MNNESNERVPVSLGLKQEDSSLLDESLVMQNKSNSDVSDIFGAPRHAP
jgi:hypothetical protein